MLQSALAILVINLILGFSVANVDNWGHMGGLAGGVIIAIGLLPRYRPPSILNFGRQPLVREPRIVRSLSWTLLCSLLFYAAFQVATPHRLPLPLRSLPLLTPYRLSPWPTALILLQFRLNPLTTNHCPLQLGGRGLRPSLVRGDTPRNAPRR